MTFAARLSASSGGKSPVFVAQFDGDLLYGFDDDPADTWSPNAEASNVAYQTTRVYGGAKALSYDKSGTGDVNGTLTNTSLNPILDLTNYAYLTLRVYLPSVAAVNQVIVRLGQDASNYWLWTCDIDTWIGGLAAGWNRIPLALDQADYGQCLTSTTGSPTKTGVNYMLIAVSMDAAGDTLTGIVFDELRGHPFRYSTAWRPAASILAPTIQGVMTFPAITPSDSRPQDGTLTSSAATFNVLDPSGSSSPVIDDISDLNMVGRGAELLMGFRGDTEAPTNYQTIYAGRVENIHHVGRAWEFTLGDRLRLLERPFAGSATESVPLEIEGNLITVLLKLALSTGGGNNLGNGAGNYDTLSEANGAGVSAWLFDVADMETVRTDDLSRDDVEFVFVEPQENLLLWIFAQCRAHGLIPRVTPAGLLTIRSVRPVFGTAAPGTTALGRTNIILDGPLPKASHPITSIYNQVRYLYDWNPTTEEYELTRTVTDDDSVTRYGLRELVVESRGVVSATVATRAARRILRRLGNGAPPVGIEVMMSKYAVALGDLVTVTDPRAIADIEAGTYGMAARLLEVEGRGFDPANRCRLALKCRNTAFRAGNYRRIHPAGAANYDSQTAAAKANYASIADTSQLLGAANDAAHEIGPG